LLPAFSCKISTIVFELLSDSELHDLITDLNDDGIDEILLAPNVKRQTENKEDLQLCQSNNQSINQAIDK
jgi:hypothetical protein